MVVYEITNKINGKNYIGFTSQERPEDRFSAHKYKANKGYKSKLYSAIRKYGEDNFDFQVIYEGTDALEKEQFFIEEKTADYNMTKGGEANQLGRTWKISEEGRKNISLAAKGKKKSPEAVEKMRLALTGRTSPLRGRILKENVTDHALYMREYRRKKREQ